MNIYGKALLVSLGIAASTFVAAVPASAQYYGRGYERYDRGHLQAQKQAIKAQREAQKRAMRGGAYNRGNAYYGGGRGGGGYYRNDAYGRAGGYADGRIGTHGPTGGMRMVPGPYGSYAVPVQPGNNNGNN